MHFHFEHDHPRTVREPDGRTERLWQVARVATAVLLAKVLFEILYAYRFYFPADFEQSDFLLGRQSSFTGLYWFAFYAHLLSGPASIVLGAWLLFTSRHPKLRTQHRLWGRIQIFLAMIVVTPSGLIMASEASTGVIAGYGFATHATLTGMSAWFTIKCARGGDFERHREWAFRNYLLLCSPLLLRVIGGALVTFDLDSIWTYRLNAWFSWIVPLTVYEAYRNHRRLRPISAAPSPIGEMP